MILKIPHSRPEFSPACEQSLLQVLASGYTACGENVAALEFELAGRVQQQAAVAVDSGTSALMLALRVLSRRYPLKRVGIPAYACASLIFAVKAMGCEPVCMDCGMDLRLDEVAAWQLASSLDAIIIVHPFGMVEPMVKAAWPCPVIEDIAQAAGAELDAQPVGSYGELSIASFYATKPWGGAYGGMVFGDLQSCHAVREMSDPDSAPLQAPYAGHHLLSNVHAALVQTRLQKSEYELQQRRSRMAWLDGLLPPRYVQSMSERACGNAYRYIIRVSDAEACIDRLHGYGIVAEKPVRQGLHRATGAECKGAELAIKTCVSLPLLISMTEQEVQHYKAGLELCLQS